MSTLKEKVAKAAKYVVVDGKPVTNSKKAEKLILKKLSSLGIFLDDDISLEILESDEIKEGDARAVFCETEPIMPVPRFRKVWSILRGDKKDNVKEAVELTGSILETQHKAALSLNEMLVKQKPVGQMSNKELLNFFSDNDESYEIELELQRRCKGQSCIVFDKNKEINIPMSAKLFSLAKKGLKIPKYYKDRDGKVYTTYKVGSFPDELYDVCPITGDILLDGHFSQEIGYSWDKFSHEKRQIIWIMSDQGSFDGLMNNGMLRQSYLNRLAKMSIEDILSEYSITAVVYEELKELGKLPSLKAKINSTSQLRNKKVSDPFNS